MTTDEALQTWWYYSIEFESGRFTPGLGFDSVALVRKLLAGVAVEGETCLDIGSMDGLVSFLMARRGGRVWSWDRIDHVAKWDWLQSVNPQAFPKPGVRIGPSLRGLAGGLSGLELPRVAIFAGVLYHVFDPLASLLYARSCLQDGGLMIVETAARVSSEPARLTFNDRGRFYQDPGAGNYWLPSPDALDAMLRIARLQTIERAFFPQHDNVVRLANVCRAVGHDIGDDWELQRNASENHRLTVGEFLDWRRTTAPDDSEPVLYTPQIGGSRAYQMPEEERRRLSVLRLADLI
jgi:SAM-dependent methyltransferase